MKIYVYGTGKYANSFLSYASELIDIIAGFIETRKTRNKFRDKPVFEIATFTDDYDLIIVASQFVYEIKAELYRYNFDFQKIVFLAKSWVPVKIQNGIVAYEFDKPSSIPLDGSVFFSIDSLYTTSDLLVEKYSRTYNSDTFWNNFEYYDTKVHVPHISQQQRGLLEQSFLPVITRKDCILDIGCASGEWARLLAQYVAEVDGFDISKAMINTAKRLSAECGFENLNFYCEKAIDVKFDKKYSHAMMLGVGEYHSLVELDEIIKKIASVIDKGGYFAVRDTLTMYMNKTLYMVRNQKGEFFDNYVASYKTIKKYEELFNKNGFEILEERYFYSYFHEPIELGTHGYIFRKK